MGADWGSKDAPIYNRPLGGDLRMSRDKATKLAGRVIGNGLDSTDGNANESASTSRIQHHGYVATCNLRRLIDLNPRQAESWTTISYGSGVASFACRSNSAAWAR